MAEFRKNSDEYLATVEKLWAPEYIRRRFARAVKTGDIPLSWRGIAMTVGTVHYDNRTDWTAHAAAMFRRHGFDIPKGTWKSPFTA